MHILYTVIATIFRFKFPTLIFVAMLYHIDYSFINVVYDFS